MQTNLSGAELDRLGKMNLGEIAKEIGNHAVCIRDYEIYLTNRILHEDGEVPESFKFEMCAEHLIATGIDLLMSEKGHQHIRWVWILFVLNETCISPHIVPFEMFDIVARRASEYYQGSDAVRKFRNSVAYGYGYKSNSDMVYQCKRTMNMVHATKILKLKHIYK